MTQSGLSAAGLFVSLVILGTVMITRPADTFGSAIQSDKSQSDKSQEETPQTERRDEPLPAAAAESSGEQQTGENKEPLDPLEQAVVLLNSRELQEGADSVWQLESPQTQSLRKILASSGRTGVAGGPMYRTELEKRVRTKKTEIINRWLHLGRQPSDNGGPRDREYRQLNSWIYPTGLGPKVKDDIEVIQAIRRELQREFAAQAESNPAMIGLITDIRQSYAEFAEDDEVQQSLKLVGGTLATPPPLPTLRSERAGAKEQPDQTSSQQSADASTNYGALASELNELNKAAKKTLGAWSSDVKHYVAERKRIQKIIATLTPQLDRVRPQIEQMQDSPRKNQLIENMNRQLIGPINAAKAQLKSLQRPDPLPLENNVKKMDTLLREIQSLKKNEEDRRQIDNLEKKATRERARYRKALASGKKKIVRTR